MKELYFNKVVSSASGFFLRGNKEHVIVLSVVACMLLLVGIFNFINIYTVIILKRAREFGVKKVYGASGIQVFSQIYAENLYDCGLEIFSLNLANSVPLTKRVIQNPIRLQSIYFP